MYTRLTARFLTIFLVMLPLALWGPLGDTWNHWVGTYVHTYLLTMLMISV